MANSTGRSPADDAFATFLEMKEAGALPNQDLSMLNEADTRAKIIDPIFKDVLGWPETEIRREQASHHGYSDYILGGDFSHLLVEAKRTRPRFDLVVPSRARELKLDGAHLLSRRRVAEPVRQAQRYANDRGAQFACVTNGYQFVVFKPYLPGRSWETGWAVVWHDWSDIEADFASFFSLLSRDAVISGVLVERFASVEAPTRRSYSPLDNLADPDRELVRNRVWTKIARVMGPLLTDQPSEPQAQLEILEHCYVSTPLSDQSDATLDRLIQDRPTQALADAAVVDHRTSGLSRHLEADLKLARSKAYVLTGGVGSGKTTFLRRFALVEHREMVRRYCAWFHVDYLSAGSLEPAEQAIRLRRFTFSEMRAQLRTGHPDVGEPDGKGLRTIFSEEIREAEKTSLYGVDRGSDHWRDVTNELVAALYGDDERFIAAALRELSRRGLRPVLVLDNTDQMGEAVQAEIFLLAQHMAGQFGALTIVALREEKFFAAYRRGIFDAYGDRRFHIGSPHIGKVVRERLKYGREKFRDVGASELELSESELSSIDGLLSTLIKSATGGNSNIQRMLASVSNGDMRYALGLFRDFVSSGNTDVDKILRIVGESGHYSLPFHEFAKSAILGSRRYYRSSVSHFLNLFKRTDAASASHICALRLLARLMAADRAPSSHGEGYVEVPNLLKEYRQSFGHADDAVLWLGELLRRGLVESEPPRCPEVERADAFRITAAGAYYVRYLAQSFAYLDLVFVDTPLLDERLAKNLAAMADTRAMSVRFDRVRMFLDYLQTAEDEELHEAAERSGFYRERLIGQIWEQVEREIRLIAKKTGAGA